VESIKFVISGSDGARRTCHTHTFADRLTLWSADKPIEVSYVGQPAHTSNDSLVWLPEQEVLFCGDLLFNAAPRSC
jgi:glyoxylase-like metal-dependent hydrolase (beta-lactamase superfamily II)